MHVTIHSCLNTLADPNCLWQDIRHIVEQISIVYIPKQSYEDGKYKECIIIKRYEYSTDIPKADTTLTIWGLQENAALKSILAEFRKEHPNVQTVYEIASDTSGVMTTDDVIRQFNARMFAGNGPDLILLDGLHMDTYTERGLLYDMSSELSETKKDLLPGIQKLMENNPYAVPLRITLPLVISPKDTLTDSLKSFLQQSKGMTFSTMTAEDIFDICCNFFKEGLDLNRPELTSEEITEFLQLCKTAAEDWPADDSRKQDPGLKNGTDWADLLMGKTDIAFSYANGLNQFCDFLDTIDQLSEKNISYHSAADCFFPQGMPAVNQDSPNKELAMEFVQKSLDARLQKSDLRDGFPVNVQALDFTRQ